MLAMLCNSRFPYSLKRGTNLLWQNAGQFSAFGCRTIGYTSLKLGRFAKNGQPFSKAGQQFSKAKQQISKSGQRVSNIKNQTVIADTQLMSVRPHSDLLKAAGFLILVGGTTYTLASIIEFKRIKKKVKNKFGTLLQRFQDFNITVKIKENNRSASEYLVYSIVLINIAVTLLWRVPKLQPKMYQYFTSSFASKSLCLPMLTSVFSHFSLIHLGLNMYVLHSFASSLITNFMGPEQFLAFYLTAGVFASLASLTHKSLARWPVPGLGASGAILAALAYVCAKVPDAQLALIFLPMWTFSAEKAIYGILLFDLIGLVLRFKMFDHAAHLGGTLFGLFYAAYGEKYYRETLQPFILQNYNKFFARTK